MILRLLYVGFAVEDCDRTRRTFRDLFGLSSEPMAPDSILRTEKAARIPFPNACWLYVMQSSRPDSPVCQFLERQGPGLERVAFETDDIEAEFARVRRAGVALAEEALVDTAGGRRFVVPGTGQGDHISGVTVELVESAPGTWGSSASIDSDGETAPPSGVLGLQHIGIAVRDLETTCERFARLFALEAREMRTDQHGGEQKDVMVEPGNDRLWLHVTESWGENARMRQFLEQKGEGLEHLCMEVDDIREAVVRVTGRGVPIFEHKIYTNRPDGFEAFVYPEHTTGVTVELIEPYSTSRGYRPRR